MGTNNQQQPMQRIVRPKVVLNNSNQQQQPPQPVPTRVRHTGFIAPSPAYTTDEESAMALTSQAAAVEQFKNDGRYTLVSSLPSNYYEYDFKELWIRPFTPNEARLLHMARVSGNLTYVISAIAATLSVPVSKLLIEDFEFCMYWLRMQSYPSKPFNITWTCTENMTDVPDEDATEEDLCMTENFTTVKNTNMIVDSFNSKFVLPPELAFPTMGIYEELWAIRQKLQRLEREGQLESEEYDDIVGDVYLMSIAQWLSAGSTMTEKLETLKNAPSMELQELVEREVSKIPEFGVSEDLSVTCVKCGRVARRRLSLDYLTFFP